MLSYFCFQSAFLLHHYPIVREFFSNLQKSIDEAVEFPSRCATNKDAMLHEQLREENSTTTRGKSRQFLKDPLHAKVSRNVLMSFRNVEFFKVSKTINRMRIFFVFAY